MKMGMEFTHMKHKTTEISSTHAQKYLEFQHNLDEYILHVMMRTYTYNTTCSSFNIISLLLLT